MAWKIMFPRLRNNSFIVSHLLVNQKFIMYNHQYSVLWQLRLQNPTSLRRNGILPWFVIISDRIYVFMIFVERRHVGIDLSPTSNYFKKWQMYWRNFLINHTDRTDIYSYILGIWFKIPNLCLVRSITSFYTRQHKATHIIFNDIQLLFFCKFTMQKS